MKAIILAAGYATRLYPLTKDKPKPLLDIKGKPIIDYLLDKIQDLGIVTGVFVVTNNKFFPHFLQWRTAQRRPFGITIVNDLTTSNEDRLGSLGDIQFTVEAMHIHDDVLVLAGDNLFSFPLKPLVHLFKKHNSSAVALYDVKELELAKLYGIVSLNETQKMIGFEEKPKHPKSTLSSTGVYLYPKATLQKLAKYLSTGGKSDKAGDFLVWLHKQEEVYGHVYSEPWYDIGSLEQLEKARKEFQP